MLDERAPPRRPDALQPLEDRLLRPRVTPLPMEAEREAVRLVTDPLEQLESRRIAGQHDRVGTAGHEHLFLAVDDPQLEPKLLQIMETLYAEADTVREGIGRTVVRNLKVMARMGTILEDTVRRTYPEFPLRTGVLAWQDYLPPLSPTLIDLAQRYDETATPETERSVAVSPTR